MVNNPDNSCLKILIINASPKREGHTFQLLKSALDTISEIEGCMATFFSMADILDPPDHGTQRFDQIIEKWEASDGIILGSPVYTFGPPSHIYELFNLLRARGKTLDTTSIKPIGIVAQGGGEFSGAEIAAQVLMNLSISVGCSPVSGDMPGSSQGFIGQMADNSTVSAEQLESISRLAIRVLEIARILSAGDIQQQPDLKILGVSAGINSSDQRNNLLKTVFSIIHKLYPKKIFTEVFDFAGKNVEPCHGCTQYCSSDLECIYHDAMQDFRQGWLATDAVLWVINNSKGIVPSLVAVIDRMNQVRFETFFAEKQAHMPRYLKSMALLGLGKPAGSPSAQFLHHAAVLYQNVIIPTAKNGELYFDNFDGEISSNQLEQLETFCSNFLNNSISIVSGLNMLKNKLPGEYYPSRKDYALFQHGFEL